MSTDPLFMKQSGQYYWYHNDHLGTPQMMTTSSGAVVWKAKYTSFGKAIVDPSSTVVNPLRFPGQYEDFETGLYYNWFRYYDTDIGRYLSVDPLRISNLRLLIQSYYNGLLRDLPIFSKEKAKGLLSVYFVYLNKIHNSEQLDEYSYAINNPVNWVDPTGRFGIVGAVSGAIGGAIGGAVVGAATGGWKGAVYGVFSGAVIGGVVGFFTGPVGGINAGTIGSGIVTGFLGELAGHTEMRDDMNPLERQREDIEIWRMLQEAKKINEELDYICQHTGGCDYDPCP